jgi:hypothetical protein
MKTLDFGADAQGDGVEDVEWKRLRHEPPSKSVRLVGAPSATITNDVLTFTVTLENHGDVPETVYVSRSAAYPAGGFLHLDLRGEGVTLSHRLRGPEVYAVMGQVVARRFVLPPDTAIRFDAQIPLQHFATYSGAPSAELDWWLWVNGSTMKGDPVAVSLPPR